VFIVLLDFKSYSHFELSDGCCQLRRIPPTLLSGDIPQTGDIPQILVKTSFYWHYPLL